MKNENHIFLCGKCRNEGFALLSARTQKGFSEKREHHINDLIFERLSGKMLLPYVSEKQAESELLKVEALRLYNQNHDDQAFETAHIDHPDYMVVSQPDGLVGDVGGIFIRPHLIPRHHIAFLKTPSLPDEYVKVINGFFWVTGRKWCDFVSYCPELRDGLKIATLRVYAEHNAVIDLAQDIVSAIKEVDRGADALSNKVLE